MNIGKIRSRVSQELATLRIVHDPLESMNGYEANPSHAEIRGLPQGGSVYSEYVGDLIAKCVTGTHQAIMDQSD